MFYIVRHKISYCVVWKQNDQCHLLNYYWFKIIENKESQNYAFITKI